MPKQEGLPQEEPSSEKVGMSPEELAKAKTQMDEWKYEGGKFVKEGSAAEKKTEKQRDEEEKAKQRESIITGLVKHQVESNPNAIVDMEQAKKYWGRFYDEANQGEKLDMQINESYAQKYEEGIRQKRDGVLILEQKLNLAESKKEKEEIIGEIEKLREDILSNEGEIHARRGYRKPKK